MTAEPKSISPAPVKRKGATIREQIESPDFRTAVAQVLPKHLTPDRFVRVAILALTRTPRLAECDKASLFNCLMRLSQLGLEPDGYRAHLIPYRNTKRNCVECQLIVDYKGIAELVMRSGTVSFLHADVVCENDDFDFDRGEITRHRIDFRQERGAPYAAYCRVKFKDGSERAEVMSKREVERIRARSKSADDGPWVTDWNEMSKKTVFRRLSKWLPLSPEIRDAVEADDEAFEEHRVAHARPLFDKPTVDSFLAAPAEEEIARPEAPPAPPPAEEVTPTNPDEPQVATAGGAGPPTMTEAQNELSVLVAGLGCTFGDLVKWAGEAKWDDFSDCAGYVDLPPKAVERLLKSRTGLTQALKTFKTRSVNKT